MQNATKVEKVITIVAVIVKVLKVAISKVAMNFASEKHQKCRVAEVAIA